MWRVPASRRGVVAVAEFVGGGFVGGAFGEVLDAAEHREQDGVNGRANPVEPEEVVEVAAFVGDDGGEADRVE